MDFFTVQTDEMKEGGVSLSASFKVGRSKDLMVRGRSFYAIWDENAALWSTDEYDVGRLVDQAMREYAEQKFPGEKIKIKSLTNFNSKAWTNYRNFVSQISDSFHQLDESLTFANQDVKRDDYVSRRLPYSLLEGDHSAWDEVVGTLYSVEERAKIEWAIGAVVSGDSKKIQKFFVFYGEPGSGKGTILNIIAKLFEGYTATFEAKALGNSNSSFATEAFKSNPLVAIQQDGDLSKIDDNTRLNSIVSHEDMTMNEKYKPGYTSKVNAMLFMGTNMPVKISDAKSGLIRRLIDINPTRVKIPANQYNTLIARIDFELGAIAHHCVRVYRKMGKNYYNAYRPTEMMLQTDVVFNYIEYYYEIFADQDGATLKQAYDLYKEYCAATGIERPLPQYKLREELRNYFEDFRDRATVDGHILRSYYSGFSANKFKVATDNEAIFSLVLDEDKSLLDAELAGQPAQLSSSQGTPLTSWSKVSTTLEDIDTHVEHFVMVPKQHIVIDFDLKGADSGKSLSRNLEAASSWPPTYAELSKSGAGVHLHYLYDGDVSRLSPIFSEGIEVKVFTGRASLRRRVSKCNAVPVATISGGLPLKEKPKVLATKTIESEKGLRDLIGRNLNKEIHPGTKPSIDFVEKILGDAHAAGLAYDVTDLRPKLLAFANNSSNQAMACIKTVQRMRFSSETVPGGAVDQPAARVEERSDSAPVVIFDVECFPNLFVVCWKYEGSDSVVRMINPSSSDVEGLFKFKLVGFNNRKYDNHMLYGCYMGYNNEQLYRLSKRLIDNIPNASFAAAYNLSYADIYDYSSKKQSLKKFQIELGLPHLELDLPWDEPVPPEQWGMVADYCVNDVRSTEAVHKDREADFLARRILAELSGLSTNDTTARHSAQIIFEGNRAPQSEFVYTDLSKEFDGYKYEAGKSTYLGELVGEGGYVYAEPGVYKNVALLDVASMHPTSIIHMNMFGKYTANFKELMDARLAIKRRDYDGASKMLGGRLDGFLRDAEDNYDMGKAAALAYALKIIINIVYGLTSAAFDNPFRDKRNKDNIGAKRGALFMIDLQNAVQKQGFVVTHIKTDSIKIADATPEIIDFVFEYGTSYGYSFEHEGTYDKFCLVNDAVYVARTGPKDKEEWTAVGAQFKVPYVFKTMFTGEPILFSDLAETKQVAKGHMALEFDNGGHHFVGRTGRFVPVTDKSGKGGKLMRIHDGKSYAVTGTKGYLWVEQENFEKLRLTHDDIDMSYFDKMVTVARDTIDKFGDVEEFLS